MESLLLLLAGVAVGTYFAEPIRETIPILDPGTEKEEEEIA